MLIPRGNPEKNMRCLTGRRARHKSLKMASPVLVWVGWRPQLLNPLVRPNNRLDRAAELYHRVGHWFACGIEETQT